MDKFKSNIKQLIELQKNDQARELLMAYAQLNPQDAEIYSMLSVIEVQEGNFDNAKAVILAGLDINPTDCDLLFNLGSVNEIQENWHEAVLAYRKATATCANNEVSIAINEALERLSNLYDSNARPRLAFLVKSGMDSFLGEIIDNLTADFEVKKYIVTELRQIDEALAWAEICWFEWCDELIIYGSNLPIAKEKQIICRLHSYEAFLDYPQKVNWSYVDKTIFVAEHIRDVVLKSVSTLSKDKTVIIPNGINLDKYTFRERKPGFKIAYVGYINYKKGPMLLLHTFKAIYDRDKRYQLYIAGTFQDNRDVLYFQQMIGEFGLQNNVFFEGWQDDIDKWLDDKNYLISSSILEGHPVGIMEAMSKGLKPLIHNFVGAKGIYPHKYIWTTIQDCVRMLINKEYNSKEYRDFIETNYSLTKKIASVAELFKNKRPIKEKPLVTVGILNYNGGNYVGKCIEQYLNQTYQSLEIIIVDDYSTDGSKEAIAEFEKRHKQIKAIYHETNTGGPSRALQEIISCAKGDYLHFTASDDFVATDAIEKYISCFDQNPNIDYVYGNYNVINEDGKIVDKWTYSYYESNEIVSRVFHTGSGLIPCTGLYKIDFFKRNNISWIIHRNNDLHSDTLNILHFIKYGLRYLNLPDYLFFYRLHSTNSSYSLKKRFQGTVAIMDYIIENFSEEQYLPEFKWSDFKSKEDAKIVILAQHFYELANRNLNKENIPLYLKEESRPSFNLVEEVKPFFEETTRYIKNGLNNNNIYKKELELLESKLNNLVLNE